MTSELAKKLQLQEKFTSEKYMGRWYDQAHSKNFRYQKGEFGHANYKLRPDGSVSVWNSEYIEKTKKFNNIEGHATFKGAQGKVHFFWFLPGGDYRVLSTDYENYSIVYSFSKFLCFESELVWILTRERNPSEEAVQKYFRIMNEKLSHITWDDLVRVKQCDEDSYYMAEKP